MRKHEKNVREMSWRGAAGADLREMVLCLGIDLIFNRQIQCVGKIMRGFLFLNLKNFFIKI